MNEQNKNKLPFEITGSQIMTADKVPDFIPKEPDMPEKKEDETLAALNELKAKISRFDELKTFLESQLKDIRQENKIQQERFDKLYNALSDKSRDLFKKLDNEIDYRDKLQSEISRLKSEADCVELKKALAETHANIDASVETVKHDLKIGLDKINKQEDEFSEILNSKLKEMKKIDDIIEEKLNVFRSDMTTANNREYKSLAARCEAYLKECNSRINEIKEHSISFLLQCQKQNEVIIGKIPEQKIRFNKKDMIIYGISFLCIVSLIVQIILSLR